MGVFGLSSIWNSFDFAVNCWCIVLMFSVHKRVYRKLCNALERRIPLQCLMCYSCQCCCGDHEEIAVQITTTTRPEQNQQKEQHRASADSIPPVSGGSQSPVSVSESDPKITMPDRPTMQIVPSES